MNDLDNKERPCKQGTLGDETCPNVALSGLDVCEQHAEWPSRTRLEQVARRKRKT